MWPGYSIQHAFDHWFSDIINDVISWPEDGRKDFSMDSSHNGDNCFLGAMMMVNQGNCTTFVKMLFDTKALRQLRLCDLECISGSLSDRVMYLEFSPPVTQLSLLSEYDLLRESQVALIELTWKIKNPHIASLSCSLACHHHPN